MYDTRFLVETLEKRLRYLLAEWPPEEYNAEEAKLLINLLKEYTPARMPEPAHITYGNSMQQMHIIHITPAPSQDPKNIYALMVTIVYIVTLILIAFYDNK